MQRFRSSTRKNRVPTPSERKGWPTVPPWGSRPAFPLELGDQPWKCSVFIATSVDGFIATKEGGIDWLESAGNLEANLGDQADMGMNQYMASVDCLIMGRKCMEKIAGFNLTPAQWPYGDTRIIVLSNSVKEPPSALKGRMEMYSGDIPTLLNRLDNEGHQHAYIDGGTTIQSFLNLQLISEMTITLAPILLGEGIPLFDKTVKNIKLENAAVIAYANDFVQTRYRVSYA